MSKRYEQLVFQVKELSEAHMMKTLYEGVGPELQREIVFFFDPWSEQVGATTRAAMGDVPLTEEKPEGLFVVPLQNNPNLPSDRDFIWFDASILKSSALGMLNSREKTQQLRTEYGISPECALVVIAHYAITLYGSASVSDLIARDIQTVIDAFAGIAEVAVVANEGELTELHGNFRLETRYGVLADYYAMADAALVQRNLRPNPDPLNNLLEITQGGRFYVVTPLNDRQYGYRTLRESGCIVECNGLVDLIDRMRRDLEERSWKEDHWRSRRSHMEETRGRYLPVAETVIRQELGLGGEAPQTDLLISRDGRALKLCHPDSEWGTANTWEGYWSGKHCGK